MCDNDSTGSCYITKPRKVLNVSFLSFKKEKSPLNPETRKIFSDEMNAVQPRQFSQTDPE